MEKINTEEISKNVLELVEIVMRQTDYTKKQSVLKLQEYEYDPLKVIRNFMNPENKVYYKESVPSTTNQMVYKEIRFMLDTANASYRRKKELADAAALAAVAATSEFTARTSARRTGKIMRAPETTPEHRAKHRPTNFQHAQIRAQQKHVNMNRVS